MPATARSARGGLLAAVLLIAGCGGTGEPRPPQATEAMAATSATSSVAPLRSVGALRGPFRAAPAPTPESSEHPWEPRRADAEPDVFRSAGRPPGARMAMATTFQPGSAAGTTVFFGLLHAHTMYSDGSGTPKEAFERARSAGLDFLGVTAHNHSRAEDGADATRRDRVLIASNTDLYDSPDPVSFTRRLTVDGSEQTEDRVEDSLIAAAEAATQPGFVAIYGQEFSTISSGNHLNVLGADAVITVANGDFAALYAAMAGGGAAEPVLQMNHPDVHRDLFYLGSDDEVIEQMFDDYGFDDFGHDFGALVAAADPLISLIEVLTGPAMDEAPHPTFHYPSRLVHANDYYYYLVQGFHLSPSVGHDNHFQTWGEATPARMGVLAAELSRDSLLAAMRANRSYATEDPDLHLDFSINGQAMGSVLTLDANTPLDIQLTVSDPSDPEAGYVAHLIYGDVAPQSADGLEKWILDDGVTESFSFAGDGVLTFDEYLSSGAPEFFFVALEQADGDRAWSAPVWINHLR